MDIEYGKLDFEKETFRRRMAEGKAAATETDEYREFTEKFKPKKTTDDCYTPENVYEAVREWCVKEYNLEGARIVRPFYPGGDYQRENYSGDCVVIDNPPFSILSRICAWYSEHGIRYFLFAPHLTLFDVNSGKEKYIITGSEIAYENGAKVRTGFVTNLGDAKLRVVPELHEAIEKQNKINRAEVRRELAKYAYPPELLTSAMLDAVAKYGPSFALNDEDMFFVRSLDEQKKQGKGVFGAGFLISAKAAAVKTAAAKKAAERSAAAKAAERAAAEKAAIVWPLSEREREIVAALGKKGMTQ